MVRGEKEERREFKYLMLFRNERGDKNDVLKN